ncbi:MAG: type III-B CRISPR module RAMP protein Cmr4 [Bacteroidetes bacterium]|nr:type III-B CRISPR module RAMP protein Cmr4 [Bacteroidota bacterium]
MATKMINAYFIECITNMHVGSGDANYGVVDKLVQRDPVSNYPTIHASSLKGALREHFEALWGDNSTKVNEIFGKEAKDGRDSESGEYRFFGADLAALPVRSNFRQFSMTVCSELITIVNRKSKMLTGHDVFQTGLLKDRLYSIVKPSYEVYLEDELFEVEKHVPLLRCSGIGSLVDHYAIADDAKFSMFAGNLPVIARNQLNNGISKNLWYEEVVPHQSLFITYLATTGKYLEEFEAGLLLDGQTIQVGGNASVGYGICKQNLLRMKRMEKFLPAAIESVTGCKIADDKGKVDSAFNGYISSLGASIISAGLLPTMIFFSNKGGSQADRPAVITAIEQILKKNHFLSDHDRLLAKIKLMVEKNDNPGLARLGSLISDAAVALKLAIRTFPENAKN